MTRTRLALIVLFLAAALYTAGQPPRVFAETPDNAPAAFPPHYCSDVDELAGVTNAEGGAQQYVVQLRMMQVFVKEAESRGITFCALSHLTRFSTVRAYVRQHPDSYQARRLAYPPAELLQLAADVLYHRLPDITGGMGHFDGSQDGLSIDFKP